MMPEQRLIKKFVHLLNKGKIHTNRGITQLSFQRFESSRIQVGEVNRYSRTLTPRTLWIL
jgi:hypothetical protein